MRRATVLAVEDDINLQSVMCHYLEKEGYRFLSALNRNDLVQILESTPPDLILLDLVFPDDDGLALLPFIRGKSRAAVIVVSGKDAPIDRIIGLELGADDYLTKPFEMRELSARIKAVLRRTEQGGQPKNDRRKTTFHKAGKISFNGWTLDRQQYQIFNETGASAELTSGEFKLLEALVMSPHQVMSRERLFALTRAGDDDAFDRAIDIQIGRIRKKIGDDPRCPALLKTIRGVGYLFAGAARVEE